MELRALLNPFDDEPNWANYDGMNVGKIQHIFMATMDFSEQFETQTKYKTKIRLCILNVVSMSKKVISKDRASRFRVASNK